MRRAHMPALLCLLLSATAGAAEVDSLPPSVREALSPVHIDWATVFGRDWPTVVRGIGDGIGLPGDLELPLGGAPAFPDFGGLRDAPGPDTVHFGGHLADLRGMLTEATGAMETTGEGWDIALTVVPVPYEYFRLASALQARAKDNVDQLLELPTGTKFLVAARYAAFGKRDEAERLLDSVDMAEYEALPSDQRTTLSRFANNLVRYVSDDRGIFEPGHKVIAYELLKPFALDGYGREYVHYWGAKCYDEVEDRERAAELFQMTLDLLGDVTPESPHHGFSFQTTARFYLNNCLARLGRYSEAVPALLELNRDRRRHQFWRVRASNVLGFISEWTGLPRGEVPDE